MKMQCYLNAKKTVSKMMAIVMLVAMLLSFAGCTDLPNPAIVTPLTTSSTSAVVTTTTIESEVAIVVTDENGEIVTETNGTPITSLIPASDMTTKVTVVTENNGSTRTEIKTMATAGTTKNTTSSKKATTATVTTKVATSKAPQTTLKTTAKSTAKVTTRATAAPTVKPTAKSTTKATTVPTTTTTTKAHKCVWTKVDYKSPAVGVDGYYKYVCNECGDSWTKELPGFSQGTATPEEVEAYANQYLAAKGFIINTNVSPWTTPCGFNSPMPWGDGDTLEDLIPYIELHIEVALEMRGFTEDSVGAPVTAYAEVPVVKEGVTHYDAGDMYICFY